jgi:hypothetical protein
MVYSYISEAAASLLDTRLNLNIVPKTQLVSLTSPVSLDDLLLSLSSNKSVQQAFFYDWIDRTAYKNGKPLPEKIGSMQCFMHGFQGEHLLQVCEIGFPMQSQMHPISFEATLGQDARSQTHSMTQHIAQATSRNASWVRSRSFAVALAPRVTTKKKQKWNTRGLYSMHRMETTVDHSIGPRTCNKVSGRSSKSKFV